MQLAPDQPEVIVFTSGTFDLFHVGHLNLLASSKALGHRLIVGVNSDEMLRSYKGPAVCPFEERVAMVRACRHVDEVVQQNVLLEPELVRRINPHVITLGSDWENKHLEALNWFNAQPGRRLVYLPYTPFVSTTKIVRRVLEREAVRRAAAE